MDLHPGEHVIYEGHPSWRSIFSFYLIGLVVVAAAVAIGVVADKGAIGAAAGGAILLVLLLVGWLRRVTTRYLITNRRLQVRGGLIGEDVGGTRGGGGGGVTGGPGGFGRVLGSGAGGFGNAG